MQESGSATCVHRSPVLDFLPFTWPQSTEPSSLSCAVVPVSYLFYTQQCIYVSPSLPIHPTSSSSLVSIHLFSMSVKVHLTSWLNSCIYLCIHISGTKVSENNAHSFHEWFTMVFVFYIHSIPSDSMKKCLAKTQWISSPVNGLCLQFEKNKQCLSSQSPF